MIGQLGKRLIFSSLFVAITIFTIFFAPGWFFLVVVEVFILLALNEYLDLVSKKGISLPRPVMLGLGALIPLATKSKYSLRASRIKTSHRTKLPRRL